MRFIHLRASLPRGGGGSLDSSLLQPGQWPCACPWSQTQIDPPGEACSAQTVHVAPPTSIHSGCVSYPILKRAGLEVLQLVRNGRSSVALQETGIEWHPAKHKFAGSDVQDRSRGRLVQLGGGTIHGPCGRQLELLKSAEKHKSCFQVIGATRPAGILGGPSVLRAQNALEE